MTINLGLVTSDAIVFGCDSIASATGYYLDPIALEWERGPDGNYLKDAEGKYTLKFNFDDYERVVTNAWGGVTKMFQIHPEPSPMVAVTAGLAKLNDRPIDSIAAEFMAGHKAREKKKLVNTDVICNNFLRFFRGEYEKHYTDSSLPERLKDGPEFLVGGFGRDDTFPSLYRVNVQENKVEKTYSSGKSGLTWNGQSDAVERFIRGYDSALITGVRKDVRENLKKHSTAVTEYIASLVNEILEKTNQSMPDGIEIKIPDLPAFEFNWKKYRTPLDYANLPRQEAINFVSFLVKIQAGKSRFAWGVPTVGGRTHIGVVTKENGFQPLNEPVLAHRDTGFGDDV